MDIFRMEHISKTIENKKILEDISFNIEKGEIIGFVGPNGAGKTTTIKIMAGLLSPDSGRIMINNRYIKNKTDIVESLKRISCIIENPSVYKNMTAYNNLKQFMNIDKNISSKDIHEIINFTGLSGNDKKKVKNYSLGMKQRLAIAQALITKPELLILDEPTNGLDPTGIMEFREMLLNICKKRGVSIFISSHILDELEKLCDKIIFVKKGKIVKSENTSDFKNNKYVILIPKSKDKTENVLTDISEIKIIKSLNEGYILKMPGEKISKLIFYLSDRRIEIKEIYEYHETLEEKYKEVYE